MPVRAANTDKPVGTRMNARRDFRLSHRAPFRLLWDEHSRQPKYAKAFCIDVSERGLALETSQPVPVGTRLTLRAECGTLFGSALVKHAVKRGANYVLGVQLSDYLKDEALGLVREICSSPRAR